MATITYSTNHSNTTFRFFRNLNSKHVVSDIPSGLPHHHIVIPIKGTKVTYHTKEGSVTANEGEVLYHPHNLPFTMEWFGYPKIELYIIDFTSSEFNCARIVPQIINPRIMSLITKLEKILPEGEEANLTKISLYYQILSKVYPLIQKNTSENDDRIKEAKEFIEKNSRESITVEELAEMCNMSEPHFYRMFKSITGYSPIDYKNFIKVNEAASEYMNQNYSVEYICEKYNFYSPSYFRRLLKKYLNTTPRELKQKQFYR